MYLMRVDDLKPYFKGDISTDDTVLEEHSHDYSIFKVRPSIVVYPKDVEDVKQLVRWAKKRREKKPSPGALLHGMDDEKDVTLTGRSAGTDMAGGSLTESVMVDFTKYFNHIIEISGDKDGGLGVAEPGVYYRDFEKETLKKNVYFPSYPASKDLCAIGGIVSNNSGGEKTLAYGKTEQYVEELRMVMSDGEEHVFRSLSEDELKKKIEEKNFEGELYKNLFELIEKNYEIIEKAKPNVSKNSAGYFLWNVWDREKKMFHIQKLLVGSQGTLGLVTRASLRLVPTKKYSRMAVAFLKDFKPLADGLVEEVLKFKPESFESYDDQTLKVALHYLGDIIKSMKGSVIKLAFQFIPELLMVLRGGLPKLILLIQLTSDDEKELDERIRKIPEALERFHIPVHIVKSDEEAEKYWTIRRQSFKLLTDRTKTKKTTPFIDDVIVRPEHLSEFLPKINAILEPYKDKMIYTIAGHVGDGNFHIIPLMDLSKPDIRALIPPIAQKVYELVLEYHGSFTAEHNDGLIRTPYLPLMYGEKIVKLFEETKKIFDPDGLFNPRKKTGGSFEYSFGHIKTK
jgi:FAD/FMN-containing dehydrogenase